MLRQNTCSLCTYFSLSSQGLSRQIRAAPKKRSQRNLAGNPQVSQISDDLGCFEGETQILISRCFRCSHASPLFSEKSDSKYRSFPESRVKQASMDCPWEPEAQQLTMAFPTTYPPKVGQHDLVPFISLLSGSWTYPPVHISAAWISECKEEKKWRNGKR